MEGGAFVVNHNLPNMPIAWEIAGTHDFDSDGDADILIRHEDGLVATWDMQNGAFLQASGLGMVSTAWQVAGTGEFDLV
jgi:hypothetical protein